MASGQYDDDLDEDEQIDLTVPLRPRSQAFYGEADDLRNQYQEKMALANSVPELSTSQKVLTGLLPMASMFLGAAIAGNKGGMYGAQAGLASANSFEKQALATEQNKLAQAAKEAAILYDEIKRKEDKGFQMEMADRRAADSRSLFQYKQDNKPAGASWGDEQASALAKISRGEKLTEEQEALVASDPKIAAEASRRRAIWDTSARFDKKQDNELKEKIVPGLTIVEGGRPDRKAVAEARTTYSSYLNAQDAVDQATEVFADPSATIAQKKAELSRIVIEMKTLKGMGAAFTDMERMLIANQLPGIAGASVSQIVEVLQKELEGQNPQALFSRLSRNLEVETRNALKSRAFEFDIPTYSEDELKANGYTDSDITDLRAQGRVK